MIRCLYLMGLVLEKKNSPFIIYLNKILIYIFPTIRNSTNLAALFRADAPAVLWVTDWPFFSGRLFLLHFNPLVLKTLLRQLPPPQTLLFTFHNVSPEPNPFHLNRLPSYLNLTFLLQPPLPSRRRGTRISPSSESKLGEKPVQSEEDSGKSF